MQRYDYLFIFPNAPNSGLRTGNTHTEGFVFHGHDVFFGA